jgi:hypothetical protein
MKDTRWQGQKEKGGNEESHFPDTDCEWKQKDKKLSVWQSLCE